MKFYCNLWNIINIIFITILIFLEFNLLTFYIQNLPLNILIINLILFISYLLIILINIIKTINLEKVKNNLIQSELHNKSLELLYNNIREFKHDFSNILTALGGYIYTKNITELEKFYKTIIDDYNINNNLSTLNPKIINNPAIYSILTSKYHKAYELGITINLDIFINFHNLKINSYEFCRILGILLDNAIEASNKCTEKKINIEIHDYTTQNYQILSIENTYLSQNIDMSRLFEKGYTTKTENLESHGLGLWQISKIVNKHNNINLNTNANEKIFKQTLIINYDK